MTETMKMINFVGSVLGAILISVLVVYLAHYHDFPRMFFYHGLECSGAIGGGCQ